MNNPFNTTDAEPRREDATNPSSQASSPSQSQDLAPPAHPTGRTLLPSPVASAVSFATRSTGLALRVGSVLGGLGFDAAKLTTLTSLELGRGFLEALLARAGKDTIRQSTSEQGREDAETVLERSLDNLHRTMNAIVFWTTTGFHLTGRTLSTVSGVSQLLLSALDQFFGSTDSSRAIASIITLIRREFQHPATGRQGEKVGVVDLVLGLCSLAYLQQHCRRLIDEENRRWEVDEIVWDVVVLRDGERVDIHEESLYGTHRGSYNPRPPSSAIGNVDSGIAATLERHGVQGGGEGDDDDDDDLPEIRLKQQILQSLPHGAEVAITTSVTTTKTITVDISGTPALHLSPPDGVQLIEDSREFGTPLSPTHKDSGTDTAAKYRVVYRVNRDQQRSTTFKKEEGDLIQTAGTGFVEALIDDSSDENDDREIQSPSLSPPPVPPKSSSTPQPLGRVQSPTPAATTNLLRARSSLGSSSPSLPTEILGDQKRPRMPLSSSSPATTNTVPQPTRKSSIPTFLSGKSKEEPPPPPAKPAEKKGGFRSALRKGPGPALSNLLQKEDSGSDTPSTNRKAKQKTESLLRKPTKASQARAVPPPRLHVPPRNSSIIPKRDPPRAPSRTSRPSGGAKGAEDPYPRASSRASYISVHERRRDSIVSQTDTYSIHAADDYRPVTPTFLRTEVKQSGASIIKSKSERNVLNHTVMTSPARSHRRVKSQVYTPSIYTPSIYTLKTNDSQTSLVPYAAFQRSAFSDAEALKTLRQAGTVDGIFPRHHILRNITWYMRFASAAYGSTFLRGMGIAKQMPILSALDGTHQDVLAFAHHTECDPASVLLSSFVDQQGGSDGTGSTNSGIPLVHYISLDHESKAVVLACRGTLGFEDVLADLTCDYDQLAWRGGSYQVHKGIHASARRLLYGGDGRVLATLKHALEEFTDYGLVLTGHSLGAAVTAILGIMLSEPAASGTSFVTTAEPHRRLLGEAVGAARDGRPYGGHICLPSGRPIHVYAYGPPATMSASLSRATRGLVTSIVNGNDLVPYLSLGVLHDFQAVALAFKSDNNAAKVEMRQRIWSTLQTGAADRWYNNNRTTRPANSSDDAWAYAALKVLRASMMSEKLVPPGEVFTVESTKVLRRDAFLLDNEDHIGRPARRIILRYVKDVEQRFGEVRFGVSMLMDHNPARYEDALNGLKEGIMTDA